MRELTKRRGPAVLNAPCVGGLLAWLVCTALGCATEADQRRRLMDQAQDLNVASRFGRLDVAVQFAAQEARPTFLERRRTWGREIRVLDTQVTHTQVNDSTHAEVTVQVDWTKPSEGLLHTTYVRQQWTATSKGPWKLESEKQVEGDKGLFGEDAPEQYLAPQGNTHFQTRSIGAIDG